MNKFTEMTDEGTKYVMHEKHENSCAQCMRGEGFRAGVSFSVLSLFGFPQTPHSLCPTSHSSVVDQSGQG